MELEFSRQFYEKYISDSTIIRSVGAKLYEDGRKDRRTYMTKLIVTFRNFAKASKNQRRFTVNTLHIPD
jgi:hypothetical protein